MHDVTQTLDAIKREFDSQNARIIYLQNQNKKLKEEHYKDTELQKMKEELERVRADMYRGFPISAEQEQRIKEWQDKHDAEVHGLKHLKKEFMLVDVSAEDTATNSLVRVLVLLVQRNVIVEQSLLFKICRSEIMIKIIEGNIVNAKTDFIIHQVNCQGVMGSGVAKALRDYDEGIYTHYRKFCEFCKFEPEELLGTCDAYLLKDRGQIVLSLFAQNKYGYDGKQYTDIEAFRDGLRYISQHFGVWREKNGLEGKDLCRTSVALPYKIGCVRGGADWEVVYKIIEEELKDYDVELWRLDE
ncbi:hypothetical protein DW955_03270 [Ruminococcus sp. AM45-9BH]|nr:hypothetical protein DW955_03270 [Ruminococcus sp. AM45-9BH]